MNIKQELDKSIAELLEELDVEVDEHFDDDFYNEENELLNSFDALQY